MRTSIFAPDAASPISSCLLLIPLCPNRNKGSDTQTLKCLEFAGWDSEGQFYLGSDLATQRQQPPEGSTKAAEEENNYVDKESRPAGARREEKEVNIPPGERLSIQIVCQTKLVSFSEAASVI